MVTLVLASFSTANTSPAYLPFPEAYWGNVFINGEPASIGTNITVTTTAGEVVGTGVVEGRGLYSADIFFDIPHDDIDQGADNNQQVTWYINGFTATRPAPGEDTAVSGNSNWNYTLILEMPTTKTELEKNRSNSSIYLFLIIVFLFGIYILNKARTDKIRT